MKNNNNRHHPRLCLDKCSGCGTNPAMPDHPCPMEIEEPTSCDCCKECIKGCVDRPREAPKNP